MCDRVLLFSFAHVHSTSLTLIYSRCHIIPCIPLNQMSGSGSTRRRDDLPFQNRRPLPEKFPIYRENNFKGKFQPIPSAKSSERTLYSGFSWGEGAIWIMDVLGQLLPFFLVRMCCLMYIIHSHFTQCHL